MDIVVTIPQTELKHIDIETEFAARYHNQVVQYWSVGRRPLDLNPGDRVFFIVASQIRYFHVFQSFVLNAKCEATGRVWNGINLRMSYPQIDLPKPIAMRGFQGFRYLDSRIRHIIDLDLIAALQSPEAGSMTSPKSAELQSSEEQAGAGNESYMPERD